MALNSIEKQFLIDKPTPPKQVVSLSEDILKKYVGEYQIDPTFSIAITREGKKLFAQATGENKSELFAEKEDEFFLKDIKAGISFIKGESGKIDQLTLKVSGRTIAAKRVK